MGTGPLALLLLLAPAAGAQLRGVSAEGTAVQILGVRVAGFLATPAGRELTASHPGLGLLPSLPLRSEGVGLVMSELSAEMPRALVGELMRRPEAVEPAVLAAALSRAYVRAAPGAAERVDDALAHETRRFERGIVGEEQYRAFAESLSAYAVFGPEAAARAQNAKLASHRILAKRAGADGREIARRLGDGRAPPESASGAVDARGEAGAPRPGASLAPYSGPAEKTLGGAAASIEATPFEKAAPGAVWYAAFAGLLYGAFSAFGRLHAPELPGALPDLTDLLTRLPSSFQPAFDWTVLTVAAGLLIGVLLSGFGRKPAPGGPVFTPRLLAGLPLAALLEEVLFRVVVFGGLANLLSWLTPLTAPVALLVAALASSAWFASAHRYGYWLPRFVGGLIYAYLYATQGLAAAALVHALHNMALVGAVLLPGAVRDALRRRREARAFS